MGRFDWHDFGASAVTAIFRALVLFMTIEVVNWFLWHQYQVFWVPREQQIFWWAAFLVLWEGPELIIRFIGNLMRL